MYNPGVSRDQCNRCGTERDSTDRFCRQCGAAFGVQLPAVARHMPLPIVRRQFLPAPLVGSMAVLAFGAGVEWLARRAAGGAARAAGRALIGLASGERPQRTASEATVDEVLYVRRVQVRR